MLGFRFDTQRCPFYGVMHVQLLPEARRLNGIKFACGVKKNTGRRSSSDMDQSSGICVVEGIYYFTTKTSVCFFLPD